MGTTAFAAMCASLGASFLVAAYLMWRNKDAASDIALMAGSAGALGTAAAVLTIA